MYLNQGILTMTYHQPFLETSDQLNDTELLSEVERVKGVFEDAQKSKVASAPAAAPSLELPD